MKDQFEEKSPKGQVIGGSNRPKNGKKRLLTALRGKADWSIQSGF